MGNVNSLSRWKQQRVPGCFTREALSNRQKQTTKTGFETSKTLASV